MEQTKNCNPVRVLQVVPLGTGGITSLVLNIAENLDNSRVVFDYFTFRDQKEFNEDRALSYGGKKLVIPIDKYNNRIVRAVYKFFGTIEVLRQEKIDVIHINASSPYDVLVGVSAKLAGVRKVVFHSHNSNMKEDRSLRGRIMPICKALIPFVSDCNLACSDLAAEFMYPNKILRSKTVSMVNNGIDVSKYVYDVSVREEYRKRYKLEDKYVIGHIGRFTNQKNHTRLIDIFRVIHNKRSDAILLMIGVGELEDDIRKKVSDYGLLDSVIFFGATSEVPQMLQTMDFFLFPSLFEGLPVVGVEVQAAGLPILMADTITKEVGITDLAHYFALEKSDEEWADKVLEIACKTTERIDTSDAIRNAGFDIKDVTQKLMGLYEELFSKS